MAVDVVTTPEFKLGVPKPLFQTALMNLPVPAQRRFGVSPDGQHFVMGIPMQGSSVSPVTVSVNWSSALALQ